ncbi:hypothetical protein [Bacillus infantis]|uniref:hypothetical protein n=1 Tax=Bacillus infantis TaxID=324767 RepID=UPI002154FD9F|nr:hypothetical protein [Bacillus infantis]MCR6609428.1 hypothetical protein [Bacillus infantis]
MSVKYEQLSLLDNYEKKKTDTTSTFINNMSLPIHRWYRYSAGFSAEWVETVIGNYLEQSPDLKDINVFEPFAGSGTVLVASDKIGVNSKGIEPHPLVYKIAKSKLNWDVNTDAFLELSLNILSHAQEITGDTSGYPDLIYKCYPEEIHLQLDQLKKALIQNTQDTKEFELVWLAFVSILRSCSPAGTANWQYVLPNKTKARYLYPFDAFLEKVKVMVEDIRSMQDFASESKAELYQEDARDCPSVPDAWADLVITSPPYANNYDYADATRLEMSFLGEIDKWGDLQDKVRKYLIRSCTQHVSKDRPNTFNFVEEDILNPIRDEIFTVCKELEAERENHGGKKNYHTMIATYFFDMANVLHELRRVTKEGATVCFVIGDSAPYGVYVPVDRWLGELAISAGFKGYTFEQTRVRNDKWKNRKHEVPLKEGRLWIRG